MPTNNRGAHKIVVSHILQQLPTHTEFTYYPKAHQAAMQIGIISFRFCHYIFTLCNEYIPIGLQENLLHTKKVFCIS